MRGGEVYRFEAISRALAAAPEFAMALTRPGAEAIAAEAAAEAEAAQMAAEVVAEAAALERRHIPYKLRSRRMLAAAAAAAAEQQTTTTTTRLEGDAVVAAEAPTAAMAAAAATAAMTAAAAAITAAEASMTLKEEAEVAADEAAEGVASGAAASSGASACIRLDQCMHASSVASSPMDVAVHAFDRRFERLERARHGAGLCEHAGTLTLTLPLTTYTGRVNEETFAKEAVWLANDRLVATGGDCGRLYIWSAVSGRLVYRAQADGSIVNCVAPHPSLPFVAVSGIDDGIKLFRVGGESHPPSKAPLFASCAPEANFHGWAVDAPPRCAALPADDCTVRLRSAGALRSEALKCLNRSQPKSTIQLLEAALHLVHVDVDVPNTALRLALGAERRQLWLLLASAWLEYGQPSAAHAWCDVLLASATVGATASVGGAAAGVDFDFVPTAVAVAEPTAAQDDAAATTDTVTAAARLEDARVIGKGYYRRATARLLLGRFDEAEEDVAAAQASEAAMAVDTEPGLRRMCDSLRARIGAARLSAHSHWERRLRRQWERQLRRRAPAEQDESEYQSDEEGSDEVEIAISDEVEMAHLCVGGEGDVGEEAQSGEEGEDEDEDEDEDEEEEDEGEEEEDDEDEDEDEDEDGDGEEDEDEDEDDEEDEDEDEEEAEEAEAEEEAEEAYDSALSPSAHNGGEGEDAHEDAEPSGAS